MDRFSEGFAAGQNENRSKFAAFKESPSGGAESELYRTVRGGDGPTLFTIGYERRNGDDFISILVDAGVKVLIDVRDKPMSRKPDFRESALKALCEHSKISYESWKSLGSTEAQRDALKESGDFKRFAKDFRMYAKRNQKDAISALAERISGNKRVFALVCYERSHDECHRSVIAELLAEKIDCKVIAIR